MNEVAKSEVKYYMYILTAAIEMSVHFPCGKCAVISVITGSHVS